MAKNSMTFNASIRLDSAQFKKGVASVQKSLKSLQSSFLSVAGAIGLGLSFNKLGQSLLDTATKLSTAKNVLENVSKGIGEYGENLEWLRKISNEYGQDMITLVNSFAQFRAAASSSKMSLDEMRDVYESLTRAAGAFHLSSDKTNDMMLAVTQMMSKGKVASEELRRQLGNVLPGAFNLMAQAAYNAGVITENSTAALEDAMKKGKVMADDVLPAFAKVLNEVTQGANFDSLQTSMNKLKNSWTEMVESADFEGVYKVIIDGATGVVKFFTDSFWTKIFSGLAFVVGSTVVPRAWRTFIAGARQAQVAAVSEFNKVYEAAAKVDDKIASIYDYRRDRNRGISKHAMASTNPSIKGHISFLQVNEKELKNLHYTDQQIQSLRKHVLEYNESLVKLNRTSKAGGGRRLFSSSDERRVTAYNKALKGAINSAEKSKEPFNQFNKNISNTGAVFSKAGAAIKTFGNMVKAALSSIAIGAIISAIGFVIGKVIEGIKAAKELKNIVNDVKQAVEKAASGEDNKTLITLIRIKKALEDIQDKTDEESMRKKAMLINEINKQLGLTGDAMMQVGDDITTKVLPKLDDYIAKIKEIAKQQAILTVTSEKTSEILRLEAENNAYRADPHWNEKTTYHNFGGSPGLGGTGVSSLEEGLTYAATSLRDKVKYNQEKIDELNKAIDEIIKAADENTLAAIYGGKDTVCGTTVTSGDTGDTSNKATPQSVIKDYKEELKKLDNQFKAGAILADDYKKKVEELNQKTFEEFSAFGWDKAMAALSSSADKALAEELKKTATAKLLEGLDDPQAIEEFDKEMEDEAKKALQRFQEAWDKYIEYVKKKPVMGKVDTDDSYMYSRKRKRGQTYSEYETHFNQEFQKTYENYVDDLEKYKSDLKEALKDVTDPESIKRLNQLLQETIDKLELAKLTAKDLKTKVNIAELEKDIADLKKQGLESVFSSITSIADGTDRLYRALQSIQQINDKTWKNEELEKFLTGLNAIIQAFEVIKSIIEAVNAVIETQAAIREKEAAKAIALNAAEAASESAKATAAAGAAVAGAASSTASIPIIGPALSIAAIASILAALTIGIGKLSGMFANGGIVGGSSFSGDNVLGRLNSGEMVLNRAQQRNLFDMANGKSLGSGGKVEFEIRGDRLKGVLQNYERKRNG